MFEGKRRAAFGITLCLFPTPGWSAGRGSGGFAGGLGRGSAVARPHDDARRLAAQAEAPAGAGGKDFYIDLFTI